MNIFKKLKSLFKRNYSTTEFIQMNSPETDYRFMIVPDKFENCLVDNVSSETCNDFIKRATFESDILPENLYDVLMTTDTVDIPIGKIVLTNVSSISPIYTYLKNIDKHCLDSFSLIRYDMNTGKICNLELEDAYEISNLKQWNIKIVSQKEINENQISFTSYDIEINLYRWNICPIDWNGDSNIKYYTDLYNTILEELREM